MDKKLESKIMDELKRFDEALDNGEFNLNLQQNYLQASTQLDEDSLMDKHSIVHDFIDIISGNESKQL